MKQTLHKAHLALMDVSVIEIHELSMAVIYFVVIVGINRRSSLFETDATVDSNGVAMYNVKVV